jgi:hypothetical protein
MKLATCATKVGEYLLAQLDSVCIEEKFVSVTAEDSKSSVEMDAPETLSDAGFSWV